MTGKRWSSRLRSSVLRPLPSASRAAGDQARDAHRWAEAAAHYADHLRSRPGDRGIWVQRGNCLKEIGQYDQALSAYGQALELNPADADVHLQKGHLLKLMGWRTGAIEAYRRSLEHRAKNNPAFQELLGLGAHEALGAAFRGGTGGEGAASTIFVDFTDLVVYLRHNDSMSGIQRVISNLLTHAGAFMQGGSGKGCRVVPVLPDYERNTMLSVNVQLVEGLLEAVQARKGRDVIDGILDTIDQARAPVAPAAGDSFVIAGAFWIYGRYDLLNALRLSGVNVSTYIHDLIQITDPEYVERAATNAFRRSLVDVLCVSSYIMTNSAFVAAEVRRYLAERMTFTIPVEPVTLATELGTAGAPPVPLDDEVAYLTTTDYVLVVSTIEIRKNHAYVIAIWERLMREYEGDVPNLVFVGKWGWQIEALRQQIELGDYLQGRLFVLNGIADGDLAALYRHCLFTVYPSFAEGWGLPVGESLGYGRPCIASGVTAVPEVGGTLCRYIDPHDVADGYRAVHRVLADRADLQAWQEEVRTTFRPKTWREFSVQFFETMLRFKAANAGAPLRNNVVLAAEQVATFGNGGLMQTSSATRPFTTARMTRVGGWHACEGWGCWAAKRRADLRIDTALEPGTAVIVALCLRTPGEEVPGDCRVDIGSRTQRFERLGQAPRWFVADGVVGQDGAISVVLTAGRGFAGEDGTDRYVGILALGFARADDPASRLRLMEAIVPGGLPAS